MGRMGLIRHIAASYDGAMLASAEFEHVVHMWDIKTFVRRTTFATTLDFGGERLAVSRDGRTLAVGAYKRHGVAAYDAATGAELWRRKDLKKPQYVSFANDDRSIWCCFDERPCTNLDAKDGCTVTTIRGVRKLWESPHGDDRVTETRRGYTLLRRGSKPINIPRITFAAIDVAFSESAFCISEAAGPVRLFNLASGAQLWRHDPPQYTHFLEVSYSPNLAQFTGVSWPCMYGGDYVLNLFDNKSGAVRALGAVGPCYTMAFFDRGSRMVNALGSVFEVASGKLVTKLEFPTE